MQGLAGHDAIRESDDNDEATQAWAARALAYIVLETLGGYEMKYGFFFGPLPVGGGDGEEKRMEGKEGR